ncbi:pro-epidermal growth factor isoform X2 [Takifugu flavidus]|uniref:pro-epidermal growth factor isoform X2 n=1 Tax=Takifugu flavidus TaxID=433684 RepID=UPI002544C750|nr:pro-epidermal growth factor isoform X2 [Takifugu flavidus]
MAVLIVAMPENFFKKTCKSGSDYRSMLAATTTVFICFVLQSSGAWAVTAACWDERQPEAEGNSSCISTQPFFIFGYGKAIHRMGLDGKNQRRLVAGVGRSIFLDFHFRDDTIYWADKQTGVIYKAAVRDAQRQKLFSDKHISGLAVDWIRNSIFWTSKAKGKIKKIDINGKNEVTLVRHLTQPCAITVDPIDRFLFWLAGETAPSIQRAYVTGQKKSTLIKMTQQAKALSIDRQEKRLYWVQLGLPGKSAVASCDYNGNGRHILDVPLDVRSGISVFLQHIFYTDDTFGVIKRVNKQTGEETLKVNIKPMAKAPVDIKVVHHLNQPMADSSAPGCDILSGNCVSVCSTERGTCRCTEGFALTKQGTHCEDVNECALWNHGCSLGCENIPGSYFCTCPKGYALLPDRKTCQVIVPCETNIKCGHGCLQTDEGAVCVCPEGSLLQEDGHVCTGCTAPDRGGCSQLCTSVTPNGWQCGCLPGYGLHHDGKRCIAAGPPSFLVVANLVDVRQINPDGSGDQILVEETNGAIIALDYDPVENKVYFASTSQKTIERIDFDGGSREVLVSDVLDSPEGLAIDWVHRKMYWTDKSRATVACSTLVGLNRQTIVSERLEKPRGIAVHPSEKKLFWTDTGAQPVVESASLEGKSRVVIASTDLVSPSGLTIDFTEDRLFWCDLRRGVVETAALDGSHRQVLLDNQVGRPFDLAVFEDRLWISDQEHQQLRSVHKRTGKNLQNIHGLLQPASIVVVHPLTRPGADVCLHMNGGCSQICEHKLGFAHCSCLPSYTLATDGKSCLPDSGSTESTHLSSPKNKVGDENTSQTTPGFSTHTIETNLDLNNEKRLSTDKMVSDQHDCDSLGCDVNAQCLLNGGSPGCSCVEGFTGDGLLCVESEASSPQLPTSTSADVSTENHSSDSESCPSTHDNYCLYEGVCFYFPEVDSYACNCVAGYIGERCQFSDLEWWDLQQAEEEKKKNVLIGACVVVLVSLLSIAACVTLCYRTKIIFGKHPPVDDVSESSVTDETMSVASSVPRFYTLVDSDVEGRTSPAVSRPRRAIYPSCSSETGDLPLSEDSDVSKPIRGFEGTAASAAVLDDVTSGVHRSCPSLQHSCTFTSFRPAIISIATSSDCQETREGDKAGPLSLQEAPSGTNKEPHT